MPVPVPVPVPVPGAGTSAGDSADGAGVVRIRQLTGRTPLRPAGSGAEAASVVEVELDDAVQLGRSAIAFRRADDPAGTGTDLGRAVVGRLVPMLDDPWRRAVHRAPQPTFAPAPVPPTPPVPPAEVRGPSATGLVGAAVAAVAAGVLSAVMDQLLFAVFAAIGAVAAFATWAVGWVGAWRQRRRARVAHDRAVDEFGCAVRRRHAEAEEDHRRRHPTITELLTLVSAADAAGSAGDGAATLACDVWRRRLVDGPAGVTVGLGAVNWPDGSPDDTPTSDDERIDVWPSPVLADVGVPLVIDAGDTIVLRGDRAGVRSLARSLLVQLAVLHGPADWELVVAVDDVAEWSWLGWLPQCSLIVDIAEVTAEDRLRHLADAGPRGRRRFVFTDDTAALSRRTGALRRLIDGPGVSAVVDGSRQASVPAIADAVVDVGATGAIATRPGSIDVRAAGVSSVTADAVARWLAHLVDPECPGAHAGLPATVTLADIGLAERSPTAIADRWLGAGRDPAPRTPIGLADDGVVDIDLVRDGPHALIAGTTGAGKSELLRTLVVGLAARLSPDHLTFLLVDFKGGSTFDACARLPHVVGMVTDLDDGLARRALVSLDAELTRREQLLRDAGAEDLSAYRSRSARPLPRLAVVIDEFAGLASGHPELLEALVAVAQRGRSLGIHLVLATQRPAGVVTDDIRANTNLRLALRLQDRRDAVDVVGDGAPADFPRDAPGRAALRLGSTEIVTFQTATCSGPLRTAGTGLWIERPRRPVVAGVSATGDGAGAGTGVEAPANELATLVAAVSEAAVAADVVPPRRVWSAPLPAVLERADLPRHDEWAGALGVVDEPRRQSRRPLRWSPADGNLLLVGALGAGTTSTAIMAIVVAAAEHTPAELHLYVVDGRGDPRWDDVTAALDHAVDIVRPPHVERLVRVLTRIAADLDRRVGVGCGAASGPRIVLVVDGLTTTRTSLVAVDVDVGGTLVGTLDRIIREGPAVGIVVCATNEVLPATTTEAFAHRWVFDLADGAAPGATGTTGIGHPVRRGVPGRLHIAGCEVEAQVLAPHARGTADAQRGPGGPRPIAALPSDVDRHLLDASTSSPGRDESTTEMALPIGLAADDLDVATLFVPRGDHVLITGTARTGLTTALAQVVDGWRRLHPDGVVVEATAGGAEPWLSELAALVDLGRTVLVAVDDADRVDADLLDRLAAGRQPGVTIAAAARIDAVRAAYGHWLRMVARRRCGLVLTSAGEIDGDVLGVQLPRRPPIAARPGLAWLVDRRGCRLVQIARQSIPPVRANSP